MEEEKRFQIDIPESIEGYKVTLFWGLGLKQIILVFGATLFLGFGIYNVTLHHYAATFGALVMTMLILLGIVEIRGRNFYQHLLFIFSYYKNKPRVLIYRHYSSSGAVWAQAKQLIYQKDSDTKTYILIFVGVILGLLLLILVGVYLSHVIHK